MTFKEWTAVIQVGTGVAVGIWLYRDADGLMPATIVIAILVSIARGEELKDERSDERDHSVNRRGMRNAYLVASIGGLGVLIYLALGGNPPGAAYGLFAALMLAGMTDAVSRLVYYRIG